MEQTTAQHPPLSLDSGFIPFGAFQEYTKNIRPPLLYKSKFSIAKLIEEYQVKREALNNSTLDEIIQKLEQAEAIFQQSDQSWDALQTLEEVQPLMVHIFPSFYFQQDLGFIKAPFEQHNFRFQTNELQGMLAHNRWEIKVNPKRLLQNEMQTILFAGTTILNSLYHQDVDIFSGDGMVLRDQDTQMERYFLFNFRLDYLEVKPTKPLKKLSKKQIHQLLNNLDDKELWLKHFPPENFVFEGFIIGLISDLTKQAILSTMKELAANEGGGK